MKKLILTNDDYKGYAEHIRHACRGILLNGDNVLLCYESNTKQYIIPGGGVEKDESLEQCCEREMLEETGLKVKPVNYYLEIEEHFSDWHHFNHYFICELILDTGERHLTKAEEDAGYVIEWLPLKKAIEIFGTYEDYHKIRLETFGMYRREFTALQEAYKIFFEKK